jgi:hypothetical protein
MTLIRTQDDGYVSRSNPLPITSLGSSMLVTGIVNVTTSGTRVQLPDIPCREITLIAKTGTTGVIYVGDANTSSLSYGIDLSERDSYTFAVSNANMLYIDASVSGEGVSYVAL